MRKYTGKRNVKGILCWVLLCSLFLTGCGQVVSEVGTSLEAEIHSEAKNSSSDREEAKALQGETFQTETAGLDRESEAENSEQTTKETTKEVTGKKLLEKIVIDAGVRERVWYDADLAEEDTEEIILQKLEQCESLVLKKTSYENPTHSLEDLRLLPNLKSLVIDFDRWDHSKIEDFTPIAELSKLTRLYFSYSTEEEIDLSFLGKMDTITELYLPYCQIKDTSFLGEMPQLERLSLYGTPIQDLRILEKLPELVELSLGGHTDAEHIEVVGKLVKMRDLGLQNCGIRDIEFLSNLTELQGVNLNFNSVSDLTPLAGLVKLERLGLAENNICDISPIAGLTNLFDLALDRNEICDISALSGLSHLNQAGLSNNLIQDFSPLADKEELMFASVSGNPCKDLRPVWRVPLLSFTKHTDPSEAQLEIVDNWMKEYRPDMEEYQCIDFVEEDLNEDGILDAVFVVNGNFLENKTEYAYNDFRRLFVLLQQEDGSWKEIKDAIPIEDYSGGTRGDPYRGIFAGKGYVMKKSERGSSTGVTQTDIYTYQQGELELEMRIWVTDCVYEDSYEIAMYKKGEDKQINYRIEIEDSRMVRVEMP